MYRPCGSGLRLGVSSSPWLPSGHITPTSFWFSVSLKKKTYFVFPPAAKSFPITRDSRYFLILFIDFIHCMYACPFRMKSFSCPERCGCGWKGEHQPRRLIITTDPWLPKFNSPRLNGARNLRKRRAVINGDDDDDNLLPSWRVCDH